MPSSAVGVAILLLGILSKCSADPEVTVDQGTVLGTTLTSYHGRNISAFLGIPYAQPPVGDLRFRSPVPAESWSGVYNATANAPPCLQSDSADSQEDCLTLNVYTTQPLNGTATSLQPVMVYIYGGGFGTGSTDIYTLGPEYILDHDVVMVAMNYRLGAFGFLSTGDAAAPGNFGLKDQVLAMKWVQDNIRNFGGDPDQVTLFGNSAGSVAVHLHTISDMSNGLFQQFIMQSGSALALWAYEPKALRAELAYQLAEDLNCTTNSTDMLVDCLRQANGSAVLESAGGYWTATDEDPESEESFLTDSPINLITQGKMKNLPWLHGNNRDEGLLRSVSYVKSPDTFSTFLSNIDVDLPEKLEYYDRVNDTQPITDTIQSYYLNTNITTNLTIRRFSDDSGNCTSALMYINASTLRASAIGNEVTCMWLFDNHERLQAKSWVIQFIKNRTSFSDAEAIRVRLVQNYTELISDARFFFPALSAIQEQLPFTNQSVYYYLFGYRGTFSHTYTTTGDNVDYGVTHVDEEIYLFPSAQSPVFASLGLEMSEVDLEMMEQMVEFWTSFAINGAPTLSSWNNSNIWEPYDLENQKYLQIGNNSEVTLFPLSSLRKEQMQFWAELTNSTSSF